MSLRERRGFHQGRLAFVLTQWVATDRRAAAQVAPDPRGPLAAARAYALGASRHSDPCGCPRR